MAGKIAEYIGVTAFHNNIVAVMDELHEVIWLWMGKNTGLIMRRGSMRQKSRERGQGAPTGARGQNQQSQSGGSNLDGRGLTWDAFGPPIGIGHPGDEAGRQLRREAQERLVDAQELRRLLERNSTQMQNLDKVITKYL
jgi:hypothetical protein